MSSLIIHTDGGSRGNPGKAAWGFVVLDSVTGQERYAEGKTMGIATNNEAEYQAFLESLRWLSAQPDFQDLTQVTWKLDSKLVVEQLQRHWKIKEARLLAFAQQAWQGLELLSCPFTLMYVPRAENAVADAQVNLALDQAGQV
jgi:ribonuclease HI